MDERQPVSDAEHVYRRIHRSYFQPGLAVPIQLAAFRPNQNDATGISLYREAFVTPVDTLCVVNPAKQNEYYVARLAVAALRSLGLSVLAEPDPNGPPGHAVIPELGWAAYQADRQRLKPILLELARLAGTDIVHSPS